MCSGLVGWPASRGWRRASSWVPRWDSAGVDFVDSPQMAGLACPIAAICGEWVPCGSESSTLPGWTSSIRLRWPDWLVLLRPSASIGFPVALNSRPVSEALCRWVPGVAGVPGLAGHRRGCPGGTLPGWTSPIRHRWTDWLVVLRPSASNGCLVALNPRPVSQACAGGSLGGCRRPGAGAGHRRGCRGGTLPGWASSISRRWPDWLGLLRPSASNACLVALNPRPVSEALCRWVPGVACVPGLAGHRRGCRGGTLPGWT